MAHDTPCRVKSRRETNQKMPVRQSEKRANMCELRAPSFYKTNPPLSIYICRWFYWGVGVGGERGAGAPPALRGGGGMCGHGVFHARGQRHLPHGIILAAGQGCRTRPRPASPSPATRRNSAAGDLRLTAANGGEVPTEQRPRVT